MAKNVLPHSAICDFHQLRVPASRSGNVPPIVNTNVPPIDNTNVTPIDNTNSLPIVNTNDPLGTEASSLELGDQLDIICVGESKLDGQPG